MINLNSPKDLIIPFFSKYEQSCGTYGKVFPPNSIDSRKWFLIFEKKMLEVLSKKIYFPLFRLSDGEFIFCLGRKFSHYSFLNKINALFNHIKRSLYYKSTFYSSGRKGYCETYGLLQLKNLRKIFFRNLKYISEKGILCFNYDMHELTYPYLESFNEDLKNNNISLNLNNYFQFYFVPGFFLGKRINEIYKNKKILIFTSPIKDRNIKLAKTLYKFGAKNVEFYLTSLNQPMLDKIDLDLIKVNPDLCLIGAGVGAINILYQISDLKCPCIDVGFIVDALSDFELAKTRPYYLNDYYFKNKDSW